MKLNDLCENVQPKLKSRHDFHAKMYASNLARMLLSDIEEHYKDGGHPSISLKQFASSIGWEYVEEQFKDIITELEDQVYSEYKSLVEQL